MKQPSYLEIPKRHTLWSLIKKVSEHYGGDDETWLKNYAKEIYETYDLDQLLECFSDLAKQIEPPKPL